MSFFFMQLSDPQFGMFAVKGEAPDDGSFPETALYEKAIAAANRLRPAFVVVTGDLVQDAGDEAQLAELRRISARLRGDVPLYFTTGNRDVENTPTRETLRAYRGEFGPDNYSFDACGMRGVVLNSSICADPSLVPEEWDQLLAFLQRDLSQAGDRRKLVFLHHPLFGKSPDEPDDGFAIIPRARRMPLLDILREHGVSGVFAGHWHRTAEARDGDMLMVITGPVGYPIADDPSGLRLVWVHDDRIEHRYYGMDDVPERVTPSGP